MQGNGGHCAVLYGRRVQRRCDGAGRKYQGQKGIGHCHAPWADAGGLRKPACFANHGFKPEEVEERTRRALEDVGLPGRESYQLDELSGGQRQRLLLASVLAVHPEIIVLDEPVSAMDPDGANSLYGLLYKIHKEYGTTIVVVEHRIDYLLPYMTDLIVLKDGRLVTADKYENAARKMYGDEVLRQFIPALWRIKLGLEEKFDITLGDWRTEEEAVAELKEKGFTGGEA